MEAQSMDELESYLIDGPPPSMYYIANFISADEEQSLLQKIPANRWVSLLKRRLQAIPTQLTTSNTLLAFSLPAWLVNPVIERLDKLKVFADAPHGINHCLVNEYLPGQGIMPHEDGAAYHPIVATVSLGGTVVLDVVEKPDEASDRMPDVEPRTAWRIAQEPRSLLITTGGAYADTLHGIAEVDEDRNLTAATVANWSLLGDSQSIQQNKGCNRRTTRVSLTLRDVKKSSSAGSMIFGRSRP